MILQTETGTQKKDTFYKDAILVFTASSFTNFFNLLFQLFMVRLLSTVDYGTLNALLSITAIVSMPAGTFGTAIARFTSRYQGLDQIDKAGSLLWGAIKMTLAFGAIILCIFALGGSHIGPFLQITSREPLVLIGAVMCLMSVAPVVMGGLQGLQRFGYMATSMLLSGGVKLALGVTLVMSGLGVNGALIALLLSVLVGILIASYALREIIFTSRKVVFDYWETYKYLLPVTVTFVCFMSLTNIDVVLVKHLFEPQDAGYYSIAQIFGKIVLFLPAALSTVIFPKASYLEAQKKDTRFLIDRGLLYTGVMCVGASIVCILFPSLLLKVVAGRVEPECIPVLRIFCINMTFFALIRVLLDYYLSINDFRFIGPLVVLTILQIIFISLFHDQLLYVLYVSCGTALLLFLFSLRSGGVAVNMGRNHF